MTSRGLLATALVFCGLAVLAVGCEDATSVVSQPPGTGGANAGGASAGGNQSGSAGNIFVGGSGPGSGGQATGGNGDPCGTGNPTCQEPCIGPTCEPPGEFPLPDDDPAPGNVDADGVVRDDDGYIVLDSTSTQSDFLWIALDRQYEVGFVSKVRTTPFNTAPTYRETGRYVSVTCFSDPVRGSKEGIVLGQTPPAGLCADGVHGCCSRDETSPGPGGGHQPIQTAYNRPSRTAVDINGDVWVANRAHQVGGYAQTSATKIANDIADCIDRNGNGVIDTSSDVNNDGIITTDCDSNDLPDDIDTVCTGGMSHEFFGLDDECILFTVNLEVGGTGRPLTLGPGEGGPTDPSDAWAGMFSTGRFYRIDGKTGAIKTTVQMDPQNSVTPNPYGAVVDQFGILWAPNSYNNPHLFYFDTNNPTDQGMVQYPGGSPSGMHYGIAVDGYTDPNTSELVQQVWLGEVGTSGACRYRPVRGTFADLASGEWACAYFQGGVSQGRGIGVDNRQPTSFAWVALDGYASSNAVGAIGRVPIDITPNQSTTLALSDTLSTNTEYGITGAGVSSDGDLWAVAQDQNQLGSRGSVIHFGVADNGSMISGPDVVPLDDKPGSPTDFCALGSLCKPFPYTYSDFTGFGLANFVTPSGYYSWIESSTCPPGRTKFLRVEWDAEQDPPDTQITMIARSAPDLGALDTAAWTGRYEASPADLSSAPGPLDPNPSSHIEVLFELTSAGVGTPRLKSFKIVYECEDIIPN